MKKRKITRSQSSTALQILISIFIFALLYTSLTLMFTLGAYMSENPTGHAKALSLAALLLCGLIGGIIVGKRSGEKLCIISALLFSVLLIVLGAVFSKTAPGIGNIINYIIFTALTYVFAKIKPKGKRHKMRHR